MTRTLQHASKALLVILVLTLWPESAHAHPTGTSFRVGLGIPVLSVTHYPSPNFTGVTYGLYPVTFGVHLGVQVSHEVGLAVHVLGGGRYERVPGDDLHYVYFAAVPRFEYMFWPHGTVAPYFGFEIGVDIEGDPDVTLRDVFRTGGFFGLHIFAITEFSVDLELAVNFLYDIDADLAGVRGVLYLSTTGWLG
jgi:hypothetical protein